MLFFILSMCSVSGYLISRPIVRALGLDGRSRPARRSVNACISRRNAR